MTPDESVNKKEDISSMPPESKVTEEPIVITKDEWQADAATDEISAANENNDIPAEENATPSVEELIQQLNQMTQKSEGHWDSLVRQQAEYDNLQKRMVRELSNARKYALEKFATELLAVKDSMELGIDAAVKPETNLQTVHDGMILTLKMLTDAMTKFAITEINPIEEKFDPQWHEAMAMQPVADKEDGSILHVHQKGYHLNDRLLRPARVIVAKLIQPEEKPLEDQI